MNILFIMYPWKRVDPDTDSTLRLIHECALRGHTLAIATTGGLTIRDSVTSAFCDLYKPNGKVPEQTASFYRRAEFRHVQLPLSGFDIIFMRANPPLDSMALNFLDSVHSDTFIINDINGLRIANNKLYTASFQNKASKFVPATHVSKNRDYLKRIFEESADDKMILKPLNSFGGKGVIVLEKSARHNFSSLLDFYIGGGGSGASNYVILQEYVHGAEEGDVRIMMLNGQPIGAMRRIPSGGDVRSNVSAGGTVVKHKLTAQEKELCKFIGPRLVADGLYFTGIDVINGKLIEVNVLSPGGISRINKLNRTRLQRQVIDFAEQIVANKEQHKLRKIELRRQIEIESAQ